MLNFPSDYRHCWCVTRRAPKTPERPTSSPGAASADWRHTPCDWATPHTCLAEPFTIRRRRIADWQAARCTTDNKQLERLNPRSSHVHGQVVINLSQGSVATRWWRDDIFNGDDNTNLVLSFAITKFWKSISIWHSPTGHSSVIHSQWQVVFSSPYIMAICGCGSSSVHVCRTGMT